MKGGGDNWVRDNLRPWVATGPPPPDNGARDASHWKQALDYTAIGSDRCANPRVVYPNKELSRYTNDYGASPKWVHESTTLERGVPSPPDESTAAKLAHQILLSTDKLRKELRVVDAKRTGMIPLSTLKNVLSRSAGVAYMPVEWAKMLAAPADPTSSGSVSYKKMIEGILQKGGYDGRDAYFREEGGRWCSDTRPKNDTDDEAAQLITLEAKMAKMKPRSIELTQARQKQQALENKLRKRRAEEKKKTLKRPHTAPGKRTISGLPGERTEWPAAFTGPKPMTGPRTYTRVELPLRGEQGHGAVAAFPWGGGNEQGRGKRSIPGPHIGIKIDRQFEKAEVYRKYVAPAFVASKVHFS